MQEERSSYYRCQDAERYLLRKQASRQIVHDQKKYRACHDGAREHLRIVRAAYHPRYVRNYESDPAYHAACGYAISGNAFVINSQNILNITNNQDSIYIIQIQLEKADD